MEGLKEDSLRTARGMGYDVSVCDISLFELLAKGSKYAKAGKVAEERVVQGVQAVLDDEGITKIPAYRHDVALTSVRLRRFHQDFVDCLIIASAVEQCEGLVSEEDFVKNEGLADFVRRRKPHFKFWTLRTLGKTG